MTASPSRSSVVRIAATLGDPDGIGPEVLVRALAADPDAASGRAVVTVLGDRAAAERAAKVCGVPVPRTIVGCPETGAASALWALEEACRIARRARGQGGCDAIVTAPIHKADLTRAGFRHPGQTEFLGERLGADGECGGTTMLLAGAGLRVALVTTHVRLLDVPARITTASVSAAIRRTALGIREVYGIAAPRIGVLGLNPHAGEDGLFGPEDDLHIRPAVERCRSEGIDCLGPLPGDGTFAPRSRSRFDAIVAMYHDQGLSALKAVEGGSAVNVTLGLPVPRTSPDHGTARDIAGRGIADAASMSAALSLAIGWARRRAELTARS